MALGRPSLWFFLFFLYLYRPQVNKDVLYPSSNTEKNLLLDAVLEYVGTNGTGSSTSQTG
jgi:hypothetical protein